MKRVDDGLAFMLKKENVAWYENGEVRILDRRIYPLQTKYVVCKTCKEVANAITDMVTQSSGPWIAALQGMILGAYQADSVQESEKAKFISECAHILTHARPTTSKQMVSFVKPVLDVALDAVVRGITIGPVVKDTVDRIVDRRYITRREMMQPLVDLLPDNVTIITNCFAETSIAFVLLLCKERGKEVSLICPETRPFLQGARLTASIAHDMDIPVTVITDNMIGYVISKKIPHVFFSGADVITLDGHVVNKIGTYQIALVAHEHDIPYFVAGNVSKDNPDLSSVTIEMRNPNESLQFMGVKTTMEGVNGYYPTFDITPPKYVSGVLTEFGIVSPYDLQRYFK